MSASPLIVSFYTDPYAPHAAGLVESLEAHGLEFDVRRIDSAGGWLNNVNRKAPFLLEMMRRHPDRAMVWLDADARVRKSPVLFGELAANGCDFAAHWRHGVELLSGTMFWGASAAARRLCEAWHRRCVQHPHIWDQVSLAETLVDHGAGLRIERLPSEYTRVFDDSKMGEPVVEHLQASRELAKAV